MATADIKTVREAVAGYSSELTLWNEEQQTALLLLGKGRSASQTARDTGIAESTIYFWLRIPEYRQAVDHLYSQRWEALTTVTVANKQRRVDAQILRLEALYRIADERALHYAKNEALRQAIYNKVENDVSNVGIDEYEAGTSTGYIVKKTTVTGKSTSTEYAVDTGLLGEIRQLEKQLAIELGQWQENDRANEDDALSLLRRSLSVAVQVNVSTDTGNAIEPLSVSPGRQETPIQGILELSDFAHRVMGPPSDELTS